MIVFLVALSACATEELCMKEVQGDWVVDMVTVQTDSCKASAIWESYYDEPYTFRGGYYNAIRGPVECDFDGPASAAFYCDEIFPNVYKRAWEDEFLAQSTAAGSWAQACAGINAIDITGSTQGLVTAEDEIIVQFYGSAYCPSFDGQEELFCDVDVQWVLKPIEQP